MNQPAKKIVLFAFLLSAIFAPFAGFAPLLLCLLVLSTLWFFGSIFQALFTGTAPDRGENT